MFIEVFCWGFFSFANYYNANTINAINNLQQGWANFLAAFEIEAMPVVTSKTVSLFVVQRKTSVCVLQSRIKWKLRKIHVDIEKLKLMKTQ